MSCKICKIKNTENFQMSYVTLNNNKKPSLICQECINNDKILRCLECGLFTCSNKPHKKKEHNYKSYNYYINKLK